MASAQPECIAHNGNIVPYEQAQVHVMSPAVKYGLSVFEGLRAYWNADRKQLYVFRLEDHTERLFQSMRLLRFDAAFKADEINRVTMEVLRRNSIRESAHIRTTVYLDGKGEQQAVSPVSYTISAIEKPRASRVDKGIRCQISSWVRISDNIMPPRIKCGGNYVNGRLARFQAIQDGYDEAILLNTLGKVAEGPGTCVFLVKDGRLITPDLPSAVLESITRDSVLVLAKEAGIECIERMVDRTELYAADEAFMVGSAAEVVPIVNVDGLPVGDGRRGPLTEKLQTAYFEAASGVGKLREHWLAPVYKA